MAKITIDIDDSTAADVARLLARVAASPAADPIGPGKLTIEKLAAVLLQDAGLVVGRPDSWEASRMGALLEAHGYSVSDRVSISRAREPSQS